MGMTIEKARPMRGTTRRPVPVSEWGEGVGVSLSTVARRWGVSEEEAWELFGFIPTLSHETVPELTIRVAETGERLWMAQWILFAEDDYPDLAKRRGRDVLVAMRALSAVVEEAEPDMFPELLQDTRMVGEILSVDRLTTLAGLDPVGLRAEFDRLRAVSDEQYEQMFGERNASTAAVV